MSTNSFSLNGLISRDECSFAFLVKDTPSHLKWWPTKFNKHSTAPKWSILHPCNICYLQTFILFYGCLIFYLIVKKPPTADSITCWFQKLIEKTFQCKFANTSDAYISVFLTLLFLFFFINACPLIIALVYRCYNYHKLRYAVLTCLEDIVRHSLKPNSV